jgi:hypothetical protein
MVIDRYGELVLARKCSGLILLMSCSGLAVSMRRAVASSSNESVLYELLLAVLGCAMCVTVLGIGYASLKTVRWFVNSN